MGFDYNNLPKCEGCTFPQAVGITRIECALHWRPGTGTKVGFPDENGLECPRDTWDKVNEVTNDHRS